MIHVYVNLVKYFISFNSTTVWWRKNVFVYSLGTLYKVPSIIHRVFLKNTFPNIFPITQFFFCKSHIFNNTQHTDISFKFVTILEVHMKRVNSLFTAFKGQKHKIIYNIKRLISGDRRLRHLWTKRDNSKESVTRGGGNSVSWYTTSFLDIQSVC